MAGVQEMGYTWPNGDKFRGRMIVDTSVGDAANVPLAGVYRTKATGDTYNGTFLNWKRHGAGKLTFENGDVFDGTFVNGGVAGKGMYTVKESGVIFKGIFGRRPRSTEPPIENLDDTMLYRGLTTAHNLATLAVKDVPSRRRPSTDGHADQADTADISEATPTPAGPALAAAPPAASAAQAPHPEKGRQPQQPVRFDTHFVSHREIIWGRGEICYPNGRKFNGRFENGEPLIKSGILWIPVKQRADDDPDDVLFDTYSGAFGGFGLPHGHGRLEGARGTTYTGQFYNGVPHGVVKEELASGETYEGELLAGERDGYGKLTLPNKDVYEGTFRENKFEGRGRYYYASKGVTYDGFFLAGWREGPGRLSSTQGNIFDGFWHDDQRCGVGVSWTLSGERQEAWYLADQIFGTPRIFWHLPRALPSKIAHRVAGASLTAFYENAVLAKANVGHIVRLNLSFVPNWLAAKRRNPLPSPNPPPVKAALTCSFGYVYLELSIREPPPSAVAKAHLSVCMEPPQSAYLTATRPHPTVDQSASQTPFDSPPLIPRVRLQLFAVGSDVTANLGAMVVNTAADLKVVPLLQWYKPPCRVRDAESGKIVLCKADSSPEIQ